jgi:macrolide transport system ATP-binding/permease protein
MTSCAKPELLGSVIHSRRARRRRNISVLVGPGAVVVETKIAPPLPDPRFSAGGAAAGRPAHTSRATAAGAAAVRDDVQTDLNMMFLLLGGLSLVVGALGIAKYHVGRCHERTAEIGLRRCHCATRRHIASQFLIESAFHGCRRGDCSDPASAC